MSELLRDSLARIGLVLTPILVTGAAHAQSIPPQRIEAHKLGVLPAPGGRALSVCTDHGGRTAYSSDERNRIVAWNLSTLEEIREYPFQHPATVLAKHPTRPLLVIGLEHERGGGTVVLLELDTGARRTLISETAGKACFSPNGVLVLATAQHLLCLDLETNEPISTAVTPDARHYHLVFARSGESLYVSNLRANRHFVVDVKTGRVSRPQRYSILGIAPSGLALELREAGVYLGECQLLSLGRSGRVRDVAIDPTGERVLLLRTRTHFEDIQLASGVLRRVALPPGELQGAYGGLHTASAAISARGTIVCSGLFTGAFVWGGVRWRQQVQHLGFLRDVRFAPDGRTMACVGATATRFIDRKLQTLGHVAGQHHVTPGQLGPDFYILKHNVIELWNPRMKVPVRTFATLPVKPYCEVDTFQYRSVERIAFRDKQFFFFPNSRRTTLVGETWFDPQRHILKSTERHRDLDSVALQSHHVEPHPKDDRFLVLSYCNVNLNVTHRGGWRIHRSSDNEVLHRSLDKHAIVAGCFDQAGQRIFVCDSQNMARAYDARTFEELTVTEFPSPAWMTAWDAHHLLAYREGKLLLVDVHFNVRQRVALAGLRDKSGSPFGIGRFIVRMSHDRRRLAVGAGRNVHVYALRPARD